MLPAAISHIIFPLTPLVYRFLFLRCCTGCGNARDGQYKFILVSIQHSQLNLPVADVWFSAFPKADLPTYKVYLPYILYITLKKLFSRVCEI